MWVTIHQGLVSMKTSSDTIEKVLESRAALIDKELDLLSYVIEPAELATIVKYALSQRGKRIRAALLTLSCEAVGGNVAQSLVPAVVIEMIHNTSLILDDVIDSSQTRRGKATINARWGNNMALIACDAMLALSIRQAARTDMNITRAIIECAAGSLLSLAEGEAMELVRQDYSVDDYYRIARRKTASLFSASAEVGAMVGGGSPKEIKALAKYGECIGIAFQIRDDVLDFMADHEVLGKPLFIDLKMDRPTLVMLIAMQGGLTRERMLEMGHEELKTALEPSILKANAVAQAKVAEAKSSISILKDGNSKQALMNLCDFIITRNR